MADLRAAAQAVLDAIDAALPYAPHRSEFDRVADSADDLRRILAQAESVQPTQTFDEWIANDEGVKGFGKLIGPEWIDAARAGWNAAKRGSNG